MRCFLSLSGVCFAAALPLLASAADPAKYPTSKDIVERTINFQKYALLPRVKVKTKDEAVLDMVYATGNPRSFLPAAVVKKIGAPIVGQIDISKEDQTRASLALSGVNHKDQKKFNVARIESWDLGVGPPGKQIDVLVIENDAPGYGVIGRDWMIACKDGESGLISTPWKVYFGRMSAKDGKEAVIRPAG